jgi:hypothetical protein
MNTVGFMPPVWRSSRGGGLALLPETAVRARADGAAAATGRLGQGT